MLGGNVGGLFGIGLQIVEFLAVDQAPAVGHHGALAPFDRVHHALRLDDQRTVGPVFAVGVEQVADVAAIEFDVGGLQPAEFDERRKDVDVCGQTLDGFPGFDLSVGPADDEGDSVAAVVFRVLLATHAAVVAAAALQAAGGAVVGHEDEDRVVGDPLLLEQLHEPGHVVVDVGDHAVELGDRDLPVSFVGLGVFLGAEVRAVRRVGRDVGEEGLVFVGLDELHALVEPDIGAEPFETLMLAVDDVGVVEVVVAPVVGRLPNTAGLVIDAVLEAPVFRAVRVAVAQMPLAEHAGGIAVAAEDIGHRDFATAQHVASLNGVPDADAIGIAAGHQRRTGRCAGGVDVEVVQQRSLAAQLVDIGSLDGRVAGKGHVAIALVVGDDDHDIGLFCVRSE